MCQIMNPSIASIKSFRLRCDTSSFAWLSMITYPPLKRWNSFTWRKLMRME